MSKKVKTTIGLILLFIFGLISGVALTLFVEGGFIREALANPDHGRLIVANRLSKNLNLNPQQQDELNVILTETQEDLQAIRVQILPDVEEVFENSRTRIADILNPEQKEQFTTMYNTFQGCRERYGQMHRKRHRLRGGGEGYGRRGGFGTHKFPIPGEGPGDIEDPDLTADPDDLDGISDEEEPKGDESN